MANAAGRLAGTILSGVIYQLSGLEACLWASSLMLLGAGAISLLLPVDGSSRSKLSGSAAGMPD
jgi:predicted MFS family arabinose efflux permease